MRAGFNRGGVVYERVITRYFAGCNAGDVEQIASCLTADAVHYFPPGMYDGPWRGGREIAKRWRKMVDRIGSQWVVERMLVDPFRAEAVAEWTHYKTKDGTLLRGDEWYVFERVSGLIREIRAYYASPQDGRFPRLELEGFDYASRGYSIAPPRNDLS